MPSTSARPAPPSTATGQVRYSLDVFVADLLVLSTDDARHVIQKLARPLGLYVAHLPCGAGEESAA